jgi:hypothetical protein
MVADGPDTTGGSSRFVVWRVEKEGLSVVAAKPFSVDYSGGVRRVSPMVSQSSTNSGQQVAQKQNGGGCG